tara:strand:+ start:2049 stop:2486 length:438 start_codon:yes stop_codon:yes gene_type:complete
MKWLPTFLLIFLAPVAQAEVFRCQQADGTTVFAYVPCREPGSKSGLETDLAHKPLTVTTQETPLSKQDVQVRIEALELELDRLREAREVEIANAPFSVSGSSDSTSLKRHIRARYQKNIDLGLDELLRLRRAVNSSTQSAFVTAD